MHSLVTISLAILAFLGFQNQEQQASITPPDSAFVQPSEVAVTEVVLSGNDQMKFDKKVIRVKAGEKVRLTLKHTGKLDKTVMGHNFVLLAQGTDMAKYAQAAMKAKDNDYIPASGALEHTKVIGGGETTTIEFMPPKKGTYTFLCSFPGHYSLMNGKFIVE